MKTSTCPHNKNVHIVGKCVINECPYHMSRVNELFDLERRETDCAYYDSDIMQNVSNARHQSKSLHTLTHEVVNNGFHCENCGYPLQKGFKCVSSELCSSRRNWLQSVCSQYQIDNSISKYQVVWKLLLQNELFLAQNTLRIGYSLCNKHDVANNPNIPAEYLEHSP